MEELSKAFHEFAKSIEHIIEEHGDKLYVDNYYCDKIQEVFKPFPNKEVLLPRKEIIPKLKEKQIAQAQSQP